MIVSYAKPVDKGVTRLMYVGDDVQPRSRLPIAIAVGVVLYVLFFKR